MVTTHSFSSSMRSGAGLVAAAMLAMFAVSGCSSHAEAPPGGPRAAPVSVVPAVERTVTDSEEFSGRIEATEYVELRPRVVGTVDRVHFTDGALVTKGQLLFTIDPQPFAAEVSRSQAQVVAAQAKAALAKTELARAQSLLDSNAVSRQEYDQLAAGLRTSDADIKAAEAALRVAQLNLDHASVKAPISGRVSRANVTAGNLVNEQVILTTIAGVDRVYAYFDGSEQTYLRVKANPDKAPKVLMALANESGFPHEGKIDFIDNRLSPQTGAIRLRATFNNSAGKFTPGLAARLRMPVSQAYQAVLVPERAIGTDQTKKTVIVVGADGIPQVREVKTGALIGGMRVVQGAVKPGENVIVDGVQRVFPGMPVAATVLAADEQGMPVFPPPPAPNRTPGKSEPSKKT